MNRKTIWIGLLLLTLIVSVTSCRKKQTINLSKEQIVFTYSGGDDVFQVEANCEWTVTGMPDWITVNPVSGEKDGNVAVNVARNDTQNDRHAMLTVVSANEKAKKSIEITQTPIDISALVRKVWFTRTEERWNSDYYDVVIPESYRSWTFWADEGYDQWFFYFFEDNIGYQIHVYRDDTIYYPYHFNYEPDFDSLNICYEMVSDTVELEDYHTVVHRLDDEYFIFSHAYRPHQFEQVTAVNVTGDEKKAFRINPKKIGQKSKGPLIPVK